MKISTKKPNLIISTYDSPRNPSYGGGGAVSIQIISEHLQSKYDLTILTGKHHGVQPNTINGVKYKYIGSNLHPFVDQMVFHLATLYYSMILRYDLWIESYTPPAITGLIPLFSRQRVLGVMHMLPGLLMFKKYYLPFHYLDQVGLKLYKDVIITSEVFRKEVTTYSASTNIHIIPNGVDLPLKSRSQAKHILYIGRLDITQKGLDILIKSYQIVRPQVAYPLVIAGSGVNSQVNKLLKLVRSLKLDKSVRFVGRVDRATKAKLLAEAICVVVPSRLETFSIVAAEALYYDIPLVTFDIDGLRWIPKKSRFVASDIGISQLASQIVVACTDMKMRSKVSKNSQKLRTLFNWKEIAKKYDQTIERILYDYYK